MGSSNNIVENATIHNNYFAGNIHFQGSQIGDHYNIGNTMVTSGNLLKNVEFAYNKFDDKSETVGSTLYLHAVAYENDMQPETTFYADNNRYEHILFHHNIYTGKNAVGWQDIPDRTICTNFDTQENVLGFPVSIGTTNREPPVGVTVTSAQNNTGSDVYFFMNEKNTERFFRFNQAKYSLMDASNPGALSGLVP